MGRVRKPLRMIEEGKNFVVYFNHPLTGKTMRFVLSDNAGAAGKRRDFLNLIFLHKEHWHSPPANCPPDLWAQWLGAEARVSTDGRKVRKGKRELAASSDAVFKLQLDVDFWKGEYEKLLQLYKAQEKELIHWRGRKLRTGGPALKLGEARDQWVQKYTGRDSDHTKIVGYDLDRFVEKFGAGVDVDSLDGRESDIDAWLRGLKTKGSDDKPGRFIGAGRRQQIRRHVLRFLADSGVTLNRKAVTPVKRDEVRAARGAIRWLEKSQAETIAKNLEQPWADLFRIQVGLGLRPDELITLKRSDFSDDFAALTLSPYEHLTLKRGSRTIQVSAPVRAIVRRRFEDKNVSLLFPDPDTNKAWADPKTYNKRFNAALKAAAVGVVGFKVDCRIGRRTCASLLLRSGMSTESVGAILGDDPATVREHYAAIFSPEVDPTPAAI